MSSSPPLVAPIKLVKFSQDSRSIFCFHNFGSVLTPCQYFDENISNVLKVISIFMPLLKGYKCLKKYCLTTKEGGDSENKPVSLYSNIKVDFQQNKIMHRRLVGRVRINLVK